MTSHWIGAVALLITPCLGVAEELPSFTLPSAVSLSTSSSSSDAQSATIGLQLMLPRNFWIAGSVDSAKEKTDDFESNTTGGSVAIGTDPLAEYGIEAGIDGFGVDNQYRVREARIRGVLAPDFIFELENPGIEIGLEYRVGRFSFANSPNIIFNTAEVELETRTVHVDVTWNAGRHWTFRAYAERTSLPSAFSDLNRPLAPLFIPESAISTAVSWPDDEGGGTIGYSRGRFGVRVGLSQRHSAVSGAISALHSAGIDYRLTHRLLIGIRGAVSRSLDDTSLDPIQTAGLDLSLQF